MSLTATEGEALVSRLKVICERPQITELANSVLSAIILALERWDNSQTMHNAYKDILTNLHVHLSEWSQSSSIVQIHQCVGKLLYRPSSLSFIDMADIHDLADSLWRRDSSIPPAILAWLGERNQMLSTWIRAYLLKTQKLTE